MGEGRREKGEGRREKGEGRREKGEGRREKVKEGAPRFCSKSPPDRKDTKCIQQKEKRIY
jgi:hypothetical protein